MMASPDDVSPDAGRIDVWHFPLNPPAHVVEAQFNVLDEDERRRAKRLRIPAKRHVFILGRAVMRQTLGERLRMRAADVPLVYNPHGKPILDARKVNTPLAFNLSHAGKIGLFAVTVGRRIGIDIQDIDPRTDCVRLAERFFSPREAETLRQLPEGEQRAAFFRCWTRKEAFLKAIGRGIAMGLDAFDVSLRPDDQPALLATRFEPNEAVENWRISDLNIAQGYAAALAADLPPFAIQMMDWHWPGEGDRV